MTQRDHLREWLSRTLKQRRLDLDPAYENLAEFSRVTGIHYKTLIRIESPKGNHRFAATTLLRLDAAYQYEPGSLEAALATGRPPRPLPTRDDTTASSGPLPSGSLERLPVVRLAAPPEARDVDDIPTDEWQPRIAYWDLPVRGRRVYCMWWETPVGRAGMTKDVPLPHTEGEHERHLRRLEQIRIAEYQKQ
ncbi:MAG UNVERIFIED_CONTAM: hypothetical protein LOD86_00210 [Thermobifida fusca]